ncbi:substrate-binding periplasmic protein [Olsenella massiliensis]|uniref:substrate-binding periplasmic protein n=1 Tax=Olsenella massiliensis TaxID=1622075 RepID=UPI0009EA18CE|nr:transporter substrate-binding domain-containing protein [Olsenella massiliensis]
MTARSRTAAIAGAMALAMSLGLTGCDLPDLSAAQDVAGSVLSEVAKVPGAVMSLLPGSSPDAGTPSRPQVEQTVPDSALVTPGTLTVGVNLHGTMVPLCYQADGAVAGLDVDLASALADQMGLKVKFVDVSDPASSLGTVCDVVMGQQASDQGVYTLVGAYAETASAFFHKGSMGVARVEDLSSKKIGMQAGSVSSSALAATGLNVTVKDGYANLNDAFAALDRGEVDYVLCEAYSGAYLARGYGDVSFAGTLAAPVAEGMACASSNAELQTALGAAFDTIQGNGIYDLTRTRWMGDFAKLTPGDAVKDVPAKQPDAVTESESVSAAQAALTGTPTAGANAVSLSD